MAGQGFARPSLRRWAASVAFCGLLVCMASRPAAAADMPGESYLRGSYTADEGPGYVHWDGIYFGAHYGWSNLTTAFENLNAQTTSNGSSFGGFVGYNVQWDQNLVLGLDGGYSRPTSLETSSSVSDGLGNTQTASFKLVDYATFRARAGYAFGQFLPYAFVGGAVGRINYATTENGVVVDAKDNAYTAGFVAGLGIDVKLLPNVFLRGEWEYIAFSPVSDNRSSINTARVGVGVLF